MIQEIRSSKEPVGGMGIDRRARISAKPGAKTEIYGPKDPSNILYPLYRTNGLLFPYTPTLNDNATVNYDVYEPIHGNQNFSAFRGRALKEIQAVGTFTTMNQSEALTNIANLHFLRTITQMYFGVGGRDSAGKALRGTPPPVLLFNANGTAVYHNVPVIVTNYTVEMPMDVDYVRLNTENREISDNPISFSSDPVTSILGRNNRTGWLPTRFNITVTMTVQNTPSRLRREFNLNDFRKGDLIKNGGWI